MLQTLKKNVESAGFRFTRLLALKLVVAAIISGLIIALVYQSGFSQRIEPGKLSARPYLSAFSPVGTGDKTESPYRWTSAHSLVLLPPVGYPYQLSFQAASPNSRGSSEFTVSVSANLEKIAEFRPNRESQLYSYKVDKPYFGPGPITIEFSSPTFPLTTGQPEVGIALEMVEIKALSPTIPPPFGWAALLAAFTAFYFFLELAFQTVQRGWIIAVSGYSLSLGLVAALLLDQYLSVLMRGNLPVIAALVFTTGLLIFCLARFPRLGTRLLILLGLGWVIAGCLFYFSEGFSEPLAWRRIGFTWDELSIIFSGIPSGTTTPLLALIIALSVGLSVDFLTEIIRRRLKISLYNSILERFIINTALGLAGLSLVIFFIGVAGFLYSEVLWSLTAGIMLLAFVRLVTSKFWNLKLPEIRAVSRVNLFWITTVALLLALLFWIDLVSVQTPDFGYDSVWYHLYQAKVYNENHRLVNMVSDYAIWPAGYMSNQEMLYTYAYGLTGGSGLAQAFHWLQGVLLVPAIYIFARLYFPPLLSITAALFFYSIPLVRNLVTTCNNDLSITIFFLLSLYTLICFYKANTRKTGWWFLILTGFFAGYNSGIKHLGMVLAGLILVGLILYLWRSKLPPLISKIKGLEWNRRERLGITGIFSFLVLLVVSPWLVRGWLELGNPIYPALSPGIFSGQWWDSWSSETFANSLKNLGVGFHFGNFLALPWTIPTNIKSFDGSSGPLFLLFVPVGLFLAIQDKKNRSVIGGLSLVTLAYTAFWFFNSQQLRYLLPAYTLLSISGAYGLWKITEMTATIKFTGKFLAVLFPLFCSILVILNLPLFANLRRDFLPEVEYAYIFGKASYRQVLESNIDPPVLWLNQKLKATDRVASEEDEIEQYYTVPTILRMGGWPVEEYRLRPQLTNPQFIKTLQRLRITHLFVRASQGPVIENGPLAPYVTYLDTLNDKYLLFAFHPPQ
jgi:hypothetical protein